jgi:hypothetical protein
MNEQRNESTNERIRDLEQRLAANERALRGTRRWLGVAGAVLGLGLTLGMASAAQDEVPEVLRAHNLAIEDENGVLRVLIGNLGERMHGDSSGIAIFDEGGAERFGVGTFPDGRINMGFDAPVGVGHAMRDRLAFGVQPDGGAYLMMIDNATRVPVRIVTEPDSVGIGWLEFLDWEEDEAGGSHFVGTRRIGLEEAYEDER